MQIHLITFDIPFPADYGGVIDVFYKLRALHELGFRVTLHCFQYANRKHSVEIEHLSEKIFYYKRPISLQYFFSKMPFIIATRSCKSLLDNLLADESPILFEGLHTTFWINHPSLAHRKKVLRMHNIESQYYAHLAKLEHNFLKKVFFWTESWKLKKYEQKISHQADILFLAISEKDFFSLKNFGASHVKTLAPFHPFTKVESIVGKGNYVLFHGNLSISDNEQSAILLIEQVFSKNNIPFVIAGKSPTTKLKQIALLYHNIKVIENPNDLEMTELIREAQVNLLWSMQSEGIKLKLFYALFQGRFVLSNENIVLNTGLEKLAFVENDLAKLMSILSNIFLQNFDNEQLINRKNTLEVNIFKQKIFLKEIFIKK